MIFIIYSSVLLFLLLLFSPFVTFLVFCLKKRLYTAPFRLGIKSININEKDRPLWIHALSVGEVISAEPLVKKALYLGKQVVFSTSTYTGFKTAKNIISPYTEKIFYFPYDFVFSVVKTVRKINPILTIIVETDIWPGFLTFMKKRGLPVILVNARLSDKSFHFYKKFNLFIGPAFKSLSYVCVQTKQDYNRFNLLGVKRDNISITGNIKFDQNLKITDYQENIKKFLNIDIKRKIIVAGSTHDPEEKIILEAFLKLKKIYKDLLLIIAPRDPLRSNKIISLYKKNGVNTESLTKKIIDTNLYDVIVADVMGMLRKLYFIADITFIGGSLIDFGGHNPLEPAVYSKPVIFGQYMGDFKEPSNLLLKAKGAFKVKDNYQLYNIMKNLLDDPSLIKNTGNNAFKVFKENRGTVDKTLSIIKNFL